MIKSPCIGVCTLVNSQCVGCFRTSDEIKNWLYFSDNERKKKTKQCLKKMKSNLNNKEFS